MAEENKGGGEKSHEATAEKLRKSRKEGDVPYSPEVTAAATYVGFFLALILFAGWSSLKLHVMLTSFLDKPGEIGRHLLHAPDSTFLPFLVGQLSTAAAPLFLFLAVFALASAFAQRAMVVAPSKLKPKLSNLSLVKNAKKKYGPDGLMEFFKSFAKLSAIMLIILFAVKDRFVELPGLSGTAPEQIGELFLRESIYFLGFISVAAMAIAAIDLPWRYFQHRNRLKMTHQELKEENKETQGDPYLKNARRNRAEAIATNKMMQDVPKADIILVNPTHYAVALRWQRDKNRAPTCVAKGVDEIAAKIREIAAASGVPIKRDPPTTRSIHSLVKVGEEIKKEHYAAVAAAIHYADTIRKSHKKQAPT